MQLLCFPLCITIAKRYYVRKFVLGTYHLCQDFLYGGWLT